MIYRIGNKEAKKEAVQMEDLVNKPPRLDKVRCQEADCGTINVEYGEKHQS